MRLNSLALLLVVAQIVLGAAFHPIRQANNTVSISATACGADETITATVFQTVTAAPETITVVSDDSAAISSSLASLASVDSAQVSYQSEEAPTPGPATTDNIFTHTIVVPVVEATKASGNSTSAYYVYAGPNTTDWSYTPTQSSVAVGTTTVTVDPEPTEVTSLASPTTTIYQTIYESRTSFSTVTTSIQTALPSPPAVTYALPPAYAPNGWNSTQGNTTQSNSSDVVSAIGFDGPTTVIVHSTTTVATTTVNLTAPTSLGLSYGSTDNCTEGSGGNSTANVTERAVKKRQVCTLVSASFENGWASWCNNWDGSRTLTGTETQWTTTYVPAVTSAGTTSQPAVPVPSSSQTSAAPPASPTQPGSVTDLPPPPSSTKVAPTSTTTQNSSPAGPPSASSSCGQVGPFEINFDNLPAYSPPNNNTNLYPEIFNPYDHFFWADGWTYVPPPNEVIFPPQSGTHLGMFIPPAGDVPTTSQDAGEVPINSFGAGRRASNNTWWFDASSVYVGCNNSNSNPAIVCNLTATGYKWDPVAQRESVAVTHPYPQPPCSFDIDCTLRKIFFSPAFTGLTSLSFYADVDGEQQTFFVDTLKLSWYNNTCAAGLERISEK